MDVLRASAEQDGDQIRVTLLECEDEENDIWTVLDIASHQDLRTIMDHLDKKHDLQTKLVFVQENDGTWSDPEFITTMEALECTL